MAAVIRVKRKRTDDPADALVLSCKKSKQTDSVSLSESSDVDSVFRFAGTIAKKDEPIEQIQSAIDIAKQKLKRSRPVKILDQINSKTRDSRRTASQSNRYKVVSRHRNVEKNQDKDSEKISEKEIVKKPGVKSCNVNNPDKDKIVCEDKENSSLNGGEVKGDGACAAVCATEIEASRLFCLYDVVQEEQDSLQGDRKKSPGRGRSPNHDALMCNNVQMIREKLTIEDETKPMPKDTEYVYDLYYADPTTFDPKALEMITTITGYSHEDFVYEHDDDDNDREREYYDDDDDSNDEDNWRNDYPDEDANDYDEDGYHRHRDSDLSSDEDSDDGYTNHNAHYRYRNVDHEYEYEVQDYNDDDFDDHEEGNRNDGYIV